MAKGIFTQGLVVLLSRSVCSEEVAEYLDGYEVAGRRGASKVPEMGGPSLVISYLPEQNGYVVIDVFPSPWPDHMGDPATEAQLFASWGMGHFGPLTYPGGLERACAQSWRWSGASETVARHTAALRLRMSYVFGAGGNAPVIPDGYDPREELIFLTNLALRLAALEEAICYFNPGGEVLLPFPQLQESLKHHSDNNLPPLDVWTNVRLFNVDERWAVMDCVGLGQLDASDHEVAFPKDLTNPQEVDRFIRNITLYLLTKGDVIKDGDTINGPADRKWKVQVLDAGINDPPRKVLRWLPCDVADIPSALSGETTEAIPAKKPFWKIW